MPWLPPSAVLLALLRTGECVLQCAGGSGETCDSGQFSGRAQGGKGRAPEKPWPPAATVRTELLKNLSEELIAPGIKAKWKAAVESGEVERRMASSRAKYYLPTAQSSVEERVCMHVAFYKENFAGFNVLTDERLSGFVAACTEVYPTLSSEHRNQLEKLLADGVLHTKLYEVYQPWPEQTPESCGGGLQTKIFRDLLDEVGIDAGPYNKLGVRPLEERTVQISEIRDAFTRGEVVRFNAAKILPSWLFGINIRGIRDLHADNADNIPVNQGIFYGYYLRCHQALMELTNRMPSWGGPHSDLVQLAARTLIPWLLDGQCGDFPTLSEVARWEPNFRKEVFYWPYTSDVPQANWDEFYSYRAKNQTIPSSEINLRRLPNIAKHLHFARDLGIEDEILHRHEFLWLGSSPGGHHYDPNDNILMQITGIIDVIVFNSNCSGLLDGETGLITHLDDGVLPWATKDMPPGKVRAPWFHIRLHPGEGVAIPSGAVHRIITRDTARVGLNAFFEPRFRQMEWPGAPGNIFVRNDKDVLATRSLWVQSLGRLWDTRKLSVGFHTVRMEVI